MAKSPADQQANPTSTTERSGTKLDAVQASTDKQKGNDEQKLAFAVDSPKGKGTV
jgi:hypothetical protein